jgi:Ca2+-binding RTX toxin-like protein
MNDRRRFNFHPAPFRALPVAAAIACLLGAIAGLAPADAATVRVVGTTVRYDAEGGEINTVVVTSVPSGAEPGEPQVDAVRIRDTTAPLDAISPCFANGAFEVFCPIDDPTLVDIDLGNENDSVRQTDVATPFSLRMKVHGGLGNDVIIGGFQADELHGDAGVDILDGSDGNDVLRGGLGGDNLTGGRGRDDLDGGAGGDTLRARDGVVDVVDCGTGDDTIDVDPGDQTSQCRR